MEVNDGDYKPRPSVRLIDSITIVVAFQVLRRLGVIDVGCIFYFGK